MKKDKRIVAVLMTLGLMLMIIPAYSLSGEASQDDGQLVRGEPGTGGHGSAVGSRDHGRFVPTEK